MDAQTIKRRITAESVPVTARRGITERLAAAALGQLKVGQLGVTFASGNRMHIRGHSRPELAGELHIHDSRALLRILHRGATGLAEGYMAEEWSTTDLTGLMTLLAANQDNINVKLPGERLPQIIDRIRHFANRNSRSGSRRNISYHYDLGNDFYRLWLDESMTYSAALFESDDQSLADAQLNKYANLARMTGIKPGDHVLEIGCGWGGFAEYAARHLDCRVTGVTLSREQLDYARARIAHAGLQARVDLHLIDYRDLGGEYDRIVSIEMLEAVGEAWWPTYFSRLRNLLKPGGTAGIQVITIDDTRFESYRRGMDFIQKYIFPGGMLPSDKLLKAHFDSAGFRFVSQCDFGNDYARTLAAWESAFDANLPAVAALGYDERFVRMWHFYLAYCQAGFHEGQIDVSQYVIQKP